MGKSVLTIEDAEDGTVNLNLEHDPPLYEDENKIIRGTRAQDLASHALKHVLVETGDM